MEALRVIGAKASLRELVGVLAAANFTVSLRRTAEGPIAMSASSEQAGPFQRMAGLLMGHFAAECVHAVAVLGIADLLAN